MGMGLQRLLVWESRNATCDVAYVGKPLEALCCGFVCVLQFLCSGPRREGTAATTRGGRRGAGAAMGFGTVGFLVAGAELFPRCIELIVSLAHFMSVTFV